MSPLRRTGSWPRKQPLRSNLPLSSRSRPVVRLKPPVFKLRRPPMPKELRDLVWDRDGGRCAICGQGLSEKRWECHHRKLRSQGGRDEPANLLALHPRCHSEAHDNRTWARERGYIVHPNTDPASRAVLRHGAHWQLPAAGRWVDTTAPEGFEENAA